MEWGRATANFWEKTSALGIMATSNASGNSTAVDLDAVIQVSVVKPEVQLTN